MMELRVGIYIYVYMCISIKMDKNRVRYIGDGLFLTGEGGLGGGEGDMRFYISSVLALQSTG